MIAIEREVIEGMARAFKEHFPCPECQKPDAPAFRSHRTNWLTTRLGEPKLKRT